MKNKETKKDSNNWKEDQSVRTGLQMKGMHIPSIGRLIENGFKIV